MHTSMIVHKQWASRPDDQRFVSLTDMLEYRRGIAQRSREFVTSGAAAARVLQSTEVVGMGDLGMPMIVGKEGPTEFTHWSFGQMCRLAGAPADFMRELPGPLVRDALRWQLRNRSDDMMFYRHAPEQGVASLMAITGPKYGRVYDADVIESLVRIAGDGRQRGTWRVPGIMGKHVDVDKNNTTLYASDRDMFVFLCDEDRPVEIGYDQHRQEHGALYRGFYVRNSEVGSASWEIGCFLYNGLCANRIIWGVARMEKITLRHTSNAPSRIASQIMPALMSYARSGVSHIKDAVDKVRSIEIAKNDEDALEWLQKREFTKSEATRVIDAVKREEGHPARTLWDVTQGVTAVAREMTYADKRLAFEKRASVWLDKVAA